MSINHPRRLRSTRRPGAVTPRHRRGALALRHDTALSRHDTDAAPHQHGALALRHDTAPSRHDTNAAPHQHGVLTLRHRPRPAPWCFDNRRGALTLRHRHATTPTRRIDAAPWCFDTDTALSRHDTDAAPHQHGALALRHDTAQSRHDTDAAPHQHGALALRHDTAPSRHDTNAAPQPTRRLDTATPTPRQRPGASTPTRRLDLRHRHATTPTRRIDAAPCASTRTRHRHATTPTRRRTNTVKKPDRTGLSNTTRAAVEGGREGVEGRAAAEGTAAAAGAEASTPLDADWGLAEDAADDYPATHPLIRSTTDTDDPRETPYSLNTDGSPMYKRDLGVMGPAIHQPLVTLNTRVPTGFKANQGTDYIPFRIVSPDGVEHEARYVQVIMGPDPLVVGIIDESDKVYARPLYATPRFTYGGKPIYPNNDMVLFTEAFEDRARVDRCLDAIHDPSLTAEVHHYRAAVCEEERLNQRIDDLIAALGEVAGKSTVSCRRLEMANAMERIEDEAGTMVDHELTKKKTRRGRKVGQQPQRTRIRYEEEGFGASGRRT
ncbi:hypothetical protein EDB85DRAFT_2165494 [Lactarius pseudohatsudake]|nr:hypothetical protein EDB85DRAFT_2165494 [Lactarius pseudohatsudake]